MLLLTNHILNQFSPISGLDRDVINSISYVTDGSIFTNDVEEIDSGHDNYNTYGSKPNTNTNDSIQSQRLNIINERYIQYNRILFGLLGFKIDYEYPYKSERYKQICIGDLYKPDGEYVIGLRCASRSDAEQQIYTHFHSNFCGANIEYHGDVSEKDIITDNMQPFLDLYNEYYLSKYEFNIQRHGVKLKQKGEEWWKELTLERFLGALSKIEMITEDEFINL